MASQVKGGHKQSMPILFTCHLEPNSVYQILPRVGGRVVGQNSIIQLSQPGQTRAQAELGNITLNLFFLLQPGFLHAQLGERGEGVDRLEVVKGHGGRFIFTIATTLQDLHTYSSQHCSCCRRVHMFHNQRSHTPKYMAKTLTAISMAQRWSWQPS